MFFPVRQYEANPFPVCGLFRDIFCDKSISVVVDRQFGEHFAVFVNRVVVGFEFSFAKDDIGWQNIARADQFLFFYLMVDIAEVPEYQFGEIIAPPGSGR